MVQSTLNQQRQFLQHPANADHPELAVFLDGNDTLTAYRDELRDRLAITRATRAAS